MAQEPEITVNIRNLAVGGAGVGEVVSQEDGGEDLLGITAFVPFSAVGEVVSARITQRKDRYVHAELINVEQQSPDRIEPACQYYMACGGCDLQHVSYEQQLQSKHRMILGALQSAKLPTQVIEALKPVLPGEEYGFRRRLKLHVDASGRIGLYRAKSRIVVPIKNCAVATPEVNEILEQLAELGPVLQGCVTSVSVEADAKGTVVVLGAPYDMGENETRGIIEAAKKHFPNVMLMAAGKEVSGVGRKLLELPLNEAGSLKVRVPAGAFSQVNWKINLKLINRVVKLTELADGAEVFDLYAGAGNFAIPLALAGAQVTAVECDKRLAQCGMENAKQNGLSRSVTYVESSVEKFLQGDGISSGATIIADPPRNGLGTLINEFSPAKRLLLISCHLPSFVRDVKQLCSRGWQVDTVEPFDMFAQTSYIELLAVLTKD